MQCRHPWVRSHRDHNPNVRCLLTSALAAILAAFAAAAYGQAPRVPSPRDAVFYEVNLRAFSAKGDFKGVESRIDDIERLGANVLWLMPVTPVGKLKSAGGLGSPYAPADYTRVNPEFGTLADLKDLVSKAHSHGLCVILDWVADHTSWDHPWLAAHKDWYLQDANGNVLMPPGTNYTDVAKLDYRNAEMRKAMIAAMEYWLDAADVDGFRCDMADGVPADFWKAAIDDLRSHAKRPILMLAEGSTKAECDAGFDLQYAWNFCDALRYVFHDGKPASQLVDALKMESDRVGPGHLTMHYATNHDLYAWNDTPANLYGGTNGEFAAFALAALMGGSPLIYDGQEIGWPQKIPFFTRAPLDWSTGSALRVRFEHLMEVRSQNPALSEGSFRWFGTADVAAFTRSGYAVLINVRPFPSTFQVPDASWASGSWTDLLTGKHRRVEDAVKLEPFEVMILARG